MNAAFPYAEIEPTVEHYQRLEGLSLPDVDDRHVLAAAIAAEATVLCTANTKDFPESVTASLGVETMTPDVLLCLLITEFESRMRSAHARPSPACAKRPTRRRSARFIGQERLQQRR